jgi:hypothetical protein
MMGRIYIDDGPYISSMGCVSSMGRTYRQWAVCIVNGPYILTMGRRYCRSAVHAIDGRMCDDMRYCWAVHVFDGPYA